jgi:hypothetical protein
MDSLLRKWLSVKVTYFLSFYSMIFQYSLNEAEGGGEGVVGGERRTGRCAEKENGGQRGE